MSANDVSCGRVVHFREDRALHCLKGGFPVDLPWCWSTITLRYKFNARQHRIDYRYLLPDHAERTGESPATAWCVGSLVDRLYV
ncbi:MAG: hypothetical protein JNM42_12620 [Propionivibrio sp.]|uniref:hypothetical protein n=1 Tax=Propionivibrio sp. TaxID=2212460 RepID=UPI001A4645B9|nr:hypothetical protein [Propionivibrio sp.]MBL8415273.1 hypothetical protein [Propionivibrio sp.]